MIKQKIGVMGGTFDPPHNGHIFAARELRSAFGLDKIIFIPAGDPNFKRGKTVASKSDRLVMTALAAERDDDFIVSAMEIERPGVTYAIDTLRTLKFLLPDAELFFIAGSDILPELHNWYKIEEIFEICKFIIINRSPNSDSVFASFFESLKIMFYDAQTPDISSSDIRNRIGNGEPFEDMVPDSVARHINKNGLYRREISDEAIARKIQSMTSRKRFRHTLGVIEAALELCGIYGEDKRKAFYAGMFHDSAKELPKTVIRELIKEAGEDAREIYEKYYGVAHGFAGAVLARDYFGVYDEEILNAIRFHTSGKKSMSRLEKIIYIADKIESGRKDYKNLKQIRELAKTDLDAAVKLSLETTLYYNDLENKTTHKYTLEALEDFENALPQKEQV
jgi:nicotinate-nucleotide adenylyltransferase